MSQAPTDEERPLLPLTSVAVLGSVFTGFLFITLGVGAQLANIAFGMWFSELFVFFGVTFLVLRGCGYDAFATTGMSRPWVAGAALGLLVGGVNFFALVVPLQFVSQSLAPKELIEAFDVSGIFKRQTPIELLGVVSGVCLAAPVCEEFFFRGLMQRGAQRQWGTVRGLIITSVVFSAFHLDPVGFLARCELGFVFGLLMLRSGSIWPGIFAHLANNSISVAIYFASGESEAEAELSWWVPLTMAGVGLPLLFGVQRLAAKWPAALTPPWPAAEARRPSRPVRLVSGWIGAGALAFALLLAVDLRGVRLNVIDAFNPLKEPKKSEGVEVRRAWDALYQLRGEVRRGGAELAEYEVARKAMIADRETRKPRPLDFQF